LRALPEIAARLVAHGMGGETPAAVIASATLPNQRAVVGTLATIGDRVRDAGLEPPATLVVGDVVTAVSGARTEAPAQSPGSRPMI
jgi:siroheme synthase